MTAPGMIRLILKQVLIIEFKKGVGILIKELDILLFQYILKALIFPGQGEAGCPDFTR